MHFPESHCINYISEMVGVGEIGSAIAFQATKGHSIFFCSSNIIQKEATPQGAEIEISCRTRKTFFFPREGKDNVRIWGR